MLDTLTAADRELGAVLLRQLRESRGWSWADLARGLRDTARRLGVTSLMHRQVPSIQRTVARWESPNDRTSPGDRYQYLLAHLYARTPAGSLALGTGSDFSVLLDALRCFGTSSERLRQLTEMTMRTSRRDGTDLLGLLAPAAGSAVKTALHQQPQLDRDVLGVIHETVADINGQVGTVPFARLQLTLSPVVDLCRRLQRSDSDRRDAGLLALATDAYALAARLAFETRDDEAAIALYVDAAEAASRLPDTSHLAAVRTSHAMVTLHAASAHPAAGPADLMPALVLARAATADAHRGASYAARARAHAVHAEVCARAGQTEQSATALSRAWKTVDQLAVDDPHGGFTSERLDGFEGLCALYVGDAQHAHERLARSVAALQQPRDAVQRGIVSTDLALARLRLGDPLACVELVHKAVDITAATGGRVSAQRIRLARHQLRPWRAETFLAELDDHIHDTLIGR